MFRAMRRKRQELSAAECEEILARASHGVLALAGDEGYPYAVPMSYVYADGRFYFHSAKQGHKLDAAARCDKASFCVVGRDEVRPKLYATDYESVIAFGRLRVLTGAEADAAIVRLADRYEPDGAGRDAELAREAGKYTMLELRTEHMTGKRARLK